MSKENENTDDRDKFGNLLEIAITYRVHITNDDLKKKNKNKKKNTSSKKKKDK